MPSSSYSSISTPNPMKYDVFLSFRSADVGDNFVSHLYSALCLKKIKTYWNPHEDLMKEDEKISSGATKAIIEESKLSVVIFSENYASSPKCLHELVHVLECKGKGQFVVPVFYHVDPSNLSKQKGSKVETTFIDEVDEWRRALEAARSLSGWSSFDIRPESKLVGEIVEDVVKKLNISPSNYSELLVGIDERIEKIESMLRIGSPDAIRIVGIFGPGGMGKTTLAHVVYNKLSSHFDSCYFLWNVKDESKRHGLIELRNKLLAELLGKRNQDSSYPSFGPKFRRKKVLIVLDDVNNSNQFKLLASKQELFGHGSRIIVTTRDAQVLKSIGADVYKIEELNYQEALQLFHSTCFGKISPTKEYWELSKQIVDYANGYPLALKILCSNLYDRGIEAWEDMLTKMKEAPKIKFAKILKICYDALDSNQKEIFLDIACFYRGEKRDLVERILAHDLPTFISVAIDDLIAKSLITLGHSNELQMHDLIQEMGREIARHESFMKPGIHSRLWSAKDAHEVLKYNKGTAAIKGLSLDMSEIEEELHLDPRTFKAMANLRLLKIYSSSTDTPKTGYIHRDLTYLPDTLTYLHWEGYPSTSLPQNFSPKNLVELNLSHSKLEKLWNGVLSLENLKMIDLSHSLNLVQVPDLSRASNLKYIDIQCCTSLCDVPSDFQHLYQLTTLNLNGCLSLDKFPELPRNIKELYMSGTNIKNLPSSIERLSSLKKLELSNCKRLERLPSSICKLNALKHLNLSGCSEFECFPEIVEAMEHLLFLSLNETRIRELPSSIGNLVALEVLELEGCENLESLPRNIYSLSKLEILIASDCAKLKALPGPGQFVHFPSLSQLNLNNCSVLEVPDDQLFIFSTLECLDLSGNENIEGIPSSIKQLSRLKHLYISNCKNLRSLPEIPLSLETVDAYGCTSLKTVSSSKTALTRGWDHLYACSEKLVFFNCLKLDKNARNNLIIDSQLRILRMATVSRITSKHVIEYPSVSICYPGNQIPEWFSNQSAGSSISIELSPHWKNTNFLGFTLCVVAAPFAEHKFHPQIHFYCESHFRFKDGESRTLNCFWRGYSQDNDDEDKSRIFLKSNHVFLWYAPFHHGLEDIFSNSTEALFEFYPIDSLEEKVDFCKVKKCGIHMLYLQETAQFDLIEYYRGWEPKVEEISALCGDNSSSERGTSNPNNGIEELEEEEDVILRESQPSTDGDVDSNIGEEGNDNQHRSGCLSFLSRIKGKYKLPSFYHIFFFSFNEAEYRKNGC
ncbi:TMV resistance protein N [Morus notabilis]|uniref:ADP-ribosyl cyclase/cyclic ADP-ribose hydrolase n=1 Tax=Morus notabilis TaxID=981085 RepID=W9RU83_9ROSA|nr:TMV resistance protein N [Morus notabilis]